MVVYSSGGFRGFSRFPQKPTLKNDCITIKCVNDCGVHLYRDNRAVTVATKAVVASYLRYFMYYQYADLFLVPLTKPDNVVHVSVYLHLLNSRGSQQARNLVGPQLKSLLKIPRILKSYNFKVPGNFRTCPDVIRV